MLTLLAASLLAVDTLQLQRADLLGPYPATPVYATDTLNMKRTKLNTESLLDDNKTLALRFDKQTPSSIANGTHFKSSKATSSLCALRFNVDATNFAKATLHVASPAKYKLFINGEERSTGEICFAPGRTEFALTSLLNDEKPDSLNIFLTGNDLASLSFAGPDDKAPYNMAAMLLGDRQSWVTLSPSGKYLVTYYNNMKADGTRLYRTVLTETATERELLRLDGYTRRTWMPRRDVLYFTRQDAQNGRTLVTFDPATQRETILATRLPEGDFLMSPTEDYLIFTTSDEGAKEDNGLKHILHPDDRMPGWRSRSALFRYDLTTGIYQRLTFGTESMNINDISRDGKKLLLAASTYDPTRLPSSRTTLLQMDAYTAKVDTILADTTWIGSARFSPDATQLLIKATPAAFAGIGAEVKEGQMPQGFDYRLFLYDIATKHTTPLLPHFAPSVANYAWHAASGRIFFTADDAYRISLFQLSPATKKVERFNLPVDCIQGYSIASNMRQPTAVFFGATGERARDMYRCSLTSLTPKATRIGEVNFDEMKRHWAIGTMHDWDFRASRGDTIHGFYVLPPNFDATKKHPVIVYYYGGCVPTQKMLEYHYPTQVFAAQGYVVYVVEPSGTIGYGQEFAARHVGTWGRESADDIIEGTNAFLRAHSWTDSTAVGCIGASYGGFMTQYLQTRTNLFAAAISHAGISNIASYWGGGYWGYSYGEVAQYGDYPWNNPRLYTEQSPLFNADKINTPLLLLHGTADTNVPTNESQQLYTALRLLGKEVSYVQVEGENHVIVDYKKRLAWQNVIFAWFAKYLKHQPLWWNTLYPEDSKQR